jgi:hypothetical protein
MERTAVARAAHRWRSDMRDSKISDANKASAIESLEPGWGSRLAKEIAQAPFCSGDPKEAVARAIWQKWKMLPKDKRGGTGS